MLLLGHRASTTVHQRQISVLDHPFSLAPWVVDLCDVNLEVMKPGVPWSPSLSLALGIPAEGLYSDICWLTKGVPYPFPSLPFDFIFCWLLVGLPLEFCCTDDVWPADPLNYSQVFNKLLIRQLCIMRLLHCNLFLTGMISLCGLSTIQCPFKRLTL